MTRATALAHVLGKTLAEEIIWNEKDGWYRGVVHENKDNEMCIVFGTTHSSVSLRGGGTRLFIQYSITKRRRAGKPHTAYVEQPTSTGNFGRKFKTDDERELSEVFEKLHRTIAAQCQKRDEETVEHAPDIEKEIYEQLLS